ncbi:MAG TPA: LytTR family DNA-binding domain-containing protein [Bacteroidia bacterium]|nr:LytTR family DNA-binding domain-containing protein [Bacteroidia bacterium]HRG52880.1 LytTR family DNA-binding domain-containing protein [Bacteroidia bacterium]
MKISCLIVDDEPLAVDLLNRYVLRTSFLQCEGQCNSAIDAMSILGSKKIDLIFMDIQMPELNGIEFSRTLHKDIRVIFTTAFDDYALEGFKVNALDYLLKPFNYEEFLIAANKAKDWYELIQAKRVAEPVDDSNFIFVKSEYKRVKINLNEVLYFEGLKDYIKIWLKGITKPILTIMSLKSLETQLPSTKFMRVHRSFIIALDKIQVVERGQVIMHNQAHVKIGDQYKEKFQSFMSGKMYD